MKIAGTAPTPKQLREELDLPDSAKFKGWAVHTPEEDGFLISQTENSGTVGRIFGGNPERALLFSSVDSAGKVVVDLAYPAVVAAVFDLGEQLFVYPVAGNCHSRLDQ